MYKIAMVILTKFGMILAVAAVTSIAAISVPTIVSAQNMTGNMTSGQNTTADIDQTVVYLAVQVVYFPV